MNHSSVFLGIDLGGTKIEIIALNENGQTLYRTRTATPSSNHHPSDTQQYQAIITTICTLVTQCETQLNQFDLPLGIGIPGAISLKTGTIKNANTVCLIGQDLASDLSDQLNRSVKIENDANCFALSEAVDGAGKDMNTVFAVILGTGVGGGWVINKYLHIGSNAIAGEWGHNPLPFPSDHDLPKQTCYCGKAACIETYLSGPGFSQQTHLQFQYKASCPEIIEASTHTRHPFHQAAKKSYQLYVDRLARSLASVINIMDPDVIVLGGGVSNANALYEDVKRVWHPYIFSDSINTQLVKNVHGDSSGVRGAAWLNMDRLNS